MNKETFITEIEKLGFKYNKEDDLHETKKSMLCFRENYINVSHGKDKDKNYKYTVSDNQHTYQTIINSFNFILEGEL